LKIARRRKTKGEVEDWRGKAETGIGKNRFLRLERTPSYKNLKYIPAYRVSHPKLLVSSQPYSYLLR